MKHAMVTKAVSVLLVLGCVFGFTACANNPAAPPEDSPGTSIEPAVTPETGEDTNDELPVVRIGTTPYPMYAIWAIAEELGIDQDFGVDINLVTCTSTANGATLMVGSNDIDMSASCISEHLACVETANNIVNFNVIGDFTGFFFVAKEDNMESWGELLESYDGDVAAAKEARLNELKGKTFNCIPQRKAMIMDTIQQVGLTEDDITFAFFADDAKAANALLTGSGDIYIGSLPQQKALLKQDGFINIGGTEILGASGLWYDTMMTTEEYITDNFDTCLNTMAVYFATVNTFYKDPEAVAPIAAEYLTETSGSEYTIEDWLDMQTNYDIFQTLEAAQEAFYNPDSERYWKVSADAQLAQLVSDGALTNPSDTEYYYGQSQELFDALVADADLVAKINSYK